MVFLARRVTTDNASDSENEALAALPPGHILLAEVEVKAPMKLRLELMALSESALIGWQVGGFDESFTGLSSLDL